MTIRSAQRGAGRFGVVLFSLTMILLLAAFFEQRAIIDWYELRGYQAPQDIASLADETAMTGSARRVYYVNHPQLLEKAAFRSSCPNYGEQTIVIGCYRGNQRGIKLLKVTDSRLGGVEQVTAAHEMLHAAYDRLSRSDRAHVDKLLQDFADHTLSDERVKQTLKSYEKSEPGEQLNEMHSIFGTEIANLSPELETYYARYFTSRKQVVGYAQKYQAAFTSRQASIQQYDARLQAMGESIKTKTQQLKDEADAIDADRQKLDTYRRNGNIEVFNAGVAPFNAKVDAYNSLLNETRKLIDNYNAIVEQRNAIAAQTIELQQAIDSSSLPKSQ